MLEPRGGAANREAAELDEGIFECCAIGAGIVAREHDASIGAQHAVFRRRPVIIANVSAGAEHVQIVGASPAGGLRCADIARDIIDPHAADDLQARSSAGHHEKARAILRAGLHIFHGTRLLYAEIGRRGASHCDETRRRCQHQALGHLHETFLQNRSAIGRAHFFRFAPTTTVIAFLALPHITIDRGTVQYVSYIKYDL